MALHGVRNVFLPPTAIKLMRQVPNPRPRFPFALRTVGSGGGFPRNIWRGLSWRLSTGSIFTR